MKIIKDLENTTGEERVKALGLFSLEMGGLITPFLTREGYLDVGAGWPASLPFSRGQTRGTRAIAQLKGLQSDSGVSFSPMLTSSPLEVGGGGGWEGDLQTRLVVGHGLGDLWVSSLLFDFWKLISPEL